MSKQLTGLKAEQFKKGQQLFSLRNREREWISDINGSNAQSRNLTQKLHKLDEKVRWCWPVKCSLSRYNAPLALLLVGLALPVPPAH